MLLVSIMDLLTAALGLLIIYSHYAPPSSALLRPLVAIVAIPAAGLACFLLEPSTISRLALGCLAEWSGVPDWLTPVVNGLPLMAMVWVFWVSVASHTLHFIGTFLRDEIITQERRKLSAKYRARYEMKKRERERKERMYREEIWDLREELRARMEEDMDAETLIDEGGWEDDGGWNET